MPIHAALLTVEQKIRQAFKHLPPLGQLRFIKAKYAACFDQVFKHLGAYHDVHNRVDGNGIALSLPVFRREARVKKEFAGFVRISQVILKKTARPPSGPEPRGCAENLHRP
jgi:hypothetical protein